jgi:hypothetical protein
MENPNNIINETNETVSKYIDANPMRNVLIETTLLKTYLVNAGYKHNVAWDIMSHFAGFIFHGMENESIGHVVVAFERMLQEQTMKTKYICVCHKRRDPMFNLEKVFNKEN